MAPKRKAESGNLGVEDGERCEGEVVGEEFEEEIESPDWVVSDAEMLEDEGDDAGWESDEKDEVEDDEVPLNRKLFLFHLIQALPFSSSAHTRLYIPKNLVQHLYQVDPSEP